MCSAELAETGRAGFLTGLEQGDNVEAQRASGFENGAKGGEVDRVLSLVVGGTAAVPAVTVDGEGPWVEPVAPLVVVAEHHIGMPVGHHRGEFGVFVATSDEERPGRLDGVREHVAHEAHRLEVRCQLGGEVAMEFVPTVRVRTLGRDGDPPS